MKRIILTNFLSLLAISVFSQNDSEPSGNWKIGFIFSSDFYTNSSRVTEQGDYNGYRLDDSGYNFSAGLTGQYKISPKVGVGLEITFSKMNFDANWFCSSCDWVVYTPPVPIELQFVEIPIFTRYYFFERKIDLYADFGFVGGFLVNDVSIADINDNKFLFGVRFGVGSEIDLGEKISLSWSALYKNSLKSSSDDNTLKLRSLGLVVGVAYKI